MFRYFKVFYFNLIESLWRIFFTIPWFLSVAIRFVLLYFQLKTGKLNAVEIRFDQNCLPAYLNDKYDEDPRDAPDNGVQDVHRGALPATDGYILSLTF